MPRLNTTHLRPCHLMQAPLQGVKCPQALIEGARHGAAGLQTYEQAAALQASFVCSD